MMPIPPLRKNEPAVVFELLGVLQASLDINQTLRDAYPLLCKLVPADHGSMCVSRDEDPTRYDWSVAEIPESFFRDYLEVAQHDFVRSAVELRPNIVLCDTEMVPLPERAHLDRHPMVQYSRANHMVIEQVMAVKIATVPSWNGGLTLYRDKRRAFTDRERNILQWLLPYFASAMTNCKRYGDQLRWSAVMENAFKLYGTSMLEFSPSMECINTTKGIKEVFDRCFGKGNQKADGLPPLLSAELKSLANARIAVPPSAPWIPANPGAGVVVTFVPMVKEFGTHWIVLLDEVPEEWRAKLSPAEIDVAVRVAQGWDNAVVAEELHISPATVRTHLYNIFNKLGIGRREVLAARFKSRR